MQLKKQAYLLSGIGMSACCCTRRCHTVLFVHSQSCAGSVFAVLINDPVRAGSQKSVRLFGAILLQAAALQHVAQRQGTVWHTCAAGGMPACRCQQCSCTRAMDTWAPLTSLSSSTASSSSSVAARELRSQHYFDHMVLPDAAQPATVAVWITQVQSTGAASSPAQHAAQALCQDSREHAAKCAGDRV